MCVKVVLLSGKCRTVFLRSLSSLLASLLSILHIFLKFDQLSRYTIRASRRVNMSSFQIVSVKKDK